MKLVIHHPDAVDCPYDFDRSDTLPEAIRAEAETVASDAGSDLLDDPGEAARAELRDRVIREATAALRDTGDAFRDPLGIRWELTD